jgi:hypothetical protein
MSIRSIGRLMTYFRGVAHLYSARPGPRHFRSTADLLLFVASPARMVIDIWSRRKEVHHGLASRAVD